MRSFIASAVLLALAASSLSAPVGQPSKSSPGQLASTTPGRTSSTGTHSIQPAKFTNCTITALPTFPANQTALSVESGLTTKFLGLGVGVQNYTCSTTGTYTSAGAVATLYDISCLAENPIVTKLPSMVASASQRNSGLATVQQQLGAKAGELGLHYFIANSAGGISPKFDLSPSQGSGQFVVEAKAANLASPDGTTNVDWLELTRSSGSTSFGTQVFRINTALGQPPSSCTVGSAEISVNYAALYYFMS